MHLALLLFILPVAVVFAQTACGSPCPDATPICYPIVAGATYASCVQCRPSDGTFSYLCDCPLGHYCSAQADDINGDGNGGTCLPFTLLGQACTQDFQCTTEATSASGATVSNEWLFCTDGTCQPCQGATAPHQCAGWANGVLQSSLPGIYRQCLANGTMEGWGTVDYTLGLTPTASPSRAPKNGASHSATPSLSHGASPSTTPSHRAATSGGWSLAVDLFLLLSTTVVILARAATP
jgi:hypothetical protein